MNDYHDIMKEYQEINSELQIESDKISASIIRIKSFVNGIDSLAQNILMVPESTNPLFNSINNNFDLFSKELKTQNSSIHEDLIIPLQNLFQGMNYLSQTNLKNVNEIKLSLIEGKQKLNKSKETYVNFLKNNFLEKEKYNKDENLLWTAKRENFYQLYKYEVDKINSVIEENNIKYSKLYADMLTGKELQQIKLKNLLLKFGKIIERTGNLFIKYSNQIITNINNYKDSKNNNENIINKERFPKENLIEENTFIKEIEEEKLKEKNNKINNNEINNNQKNDFFDFDIINKSDFDDINKTTTNNMSNDVVNNKKNSNDEFELLDDTYIQSNNNNKITQINDFINKITSENEISSTEISKLMNLLKEEDTFTGKLYSFRFLDSLQKFNKNHTIFFKNGENFIHLSNIINNLSIKENKTYIFRLIIEVSQIIKYKGWYLFNLLQKKNKYFSTKTFWNTLISDSFINDLNNFVENVLNKKTNLQNTNNNSKSQHDATNNVKKTNKEDNNIYLLEFTGYSKFIKNYKKLSVEQKKKLDKYGRENVKIILNKIISGMCSFLVNENDASDVISVFAKKFGYNSETKEYYQNLLYIHLNKNYRYYLKKLSLYDNNDNKKYNIQSKINIISNSANFLPKINIINLLLLNKKMYVDIKKNVFRNYLNENDLITNNSLNERLKLWELMLNIEKIKYLYNYSDIKQKLIKKMKSGDIIKGSLMAKNNGTIELDVSRTFFKQDLEKNREIIANVLKCLTIIVQEVGYYQGMTYIAAFLLVILNYNEENTFYYLLAIEKQTKFKTIFENELHLLRLNFNAFEKMIKINLPEISQHFIDNKCGANFYSPPWFLTLFTCIINNIDRNNMPLFACTIFENFILNGWSAIFNAGYTVLKYYYAEILELKGDKLMNFMVNKFNQLDLFKNENIKEVRKLYIQNYNQINESYILKLQKICEYEEKYK